MKGPLIAVNLRTSQLSSPALGKKNILLDLDSPSLATEDFFIYPLVAKVKEIRVHWNSRHNISLSLSGLAAESRTRS